MFYVLCSIRNQKAFWCKFFFEIRCKWIPTCSICSCLTVYRERDCWLGWYANDWALFALHLVLSLVSSLCNSLLERRTELTALTARATLSRINNWQKCLNIISNFLNLINKLFIKDNEKISFYRRKVFTVVYTLTIGLTDGWIDAG